MDESPVADERARMTREYLSTWRNLRISALERKHAAAISDQERRGIAKELDGLKADRAIAEITPRQPALDDQGQPVDLDINRPRIHSRTVDELLGMARMAIADGVVSQAEAEFVRDWLERNRDYAYSWPAAAIYQRLIQMLSDKALDQEEQKELLALLKDITGEGTLGPKLQPQTSTLPLTQPPPTVVFPEKSFCVTGCFESGPRKICEAEIVARGGVMRKAVSAKLDYLVIGGFVSAQWQYSAYGNKLDAAMRLRDQVAIISEAHLIEAFVKNPAQSQ